MNNKNKMIVSAIKTAFIVSAASSIVATTSALAAGETEKCYGVVKAGMNDCHTATSSCAGSATKNGQADAWVMVPKGLCNKLVGSSLTDTSKAKPGSS